MLACLVRDRITTSGNDVPARDQEIMYKTFFFEQMEACLMDTYIIDNIFRLCGDDIFPFNDDEGLRWPQFFLDYVTSKHALKPSAYAAGRMKKAYANKTEKEVRDMTFSLLIKDTSAEARAEINNRLGKLWRDVLDSGETRSGLFDVIRETTKQRDAFLRGRAAANVRTPAIRREGPQYRENVERRTNEALTKLNLNPHYFPHYWLTFAMFGPPAPATKRLPILTIQNVNDLQEQFVGVYDGKKLNKASRKHARNQAAYAELKKLKSNSGSTFTPAKSEAPLNDVQEFINGSDGKKSRGSPFPTQFQHKIEIQNVQEYFPMAPVQVPPVSREEKILSDIITLYKDLGKDDSGRFLKQVEIEEYTEKLVNLKLSNMPKDLF